MLNKIKNSKPLTAILLVVLFGIIGGTIAYYQSTDTFTNEFDAGKYVIKTEETFESPSNWTPGDVTEKHLTVTNQGTVPAAVKVCFTPSWEDENGDPLPLFDDNYEFAALIELDRDYDLYWKDDCDNDYESHYCYYYHRALNPGETTEQLLDSVTYNPYFELNNNTTCTTDPETHKQTCTTELDGYSGGKYKLDINIETVQFNQYQNVWNGCQVMGSMGNCENLNISSRNIYHNMLMTNTRGNSYYVFNSTRAFIPESLEIKDNKNIPDNAIYSWDVSFLGDEGVMAWITDIDNDLYYELYIGADGGVIANPNSQYAFSGFDYLKKIDITNLDTSEVRDMSSMFGMIGFNVTGNTNYIGFENLDTSKVENMSYMFYKANSSSTSINFSNWDISNVIYDCEMFLDSGLSSSNVGNWGNNCPPPLPPSA